MSSSVFFISDTHFGHKAIIWFEKEHRPFQTIEEHDEELIQRWNSIVGKRDVVYHLGDVLFGTGSFHRVLSRLLGTKKLVLGNHDRYSKDRYLQYFSKVEGCMKFDDSILTHIPVHPYQLEYRFKYNMHGHMHSKKLDDPRYINLSCEQINLTPKPYEEIK